MPKTFHLIVYQHNSIIHVKPHVKLSYMFCHPKNTPYLR